MKKIISTNYMETNTLNNLTKSQLINLVLKLNANIEKLQNQIVKKQPEPIKPIPLPRKSVKQMVQDYEENIIDPPIPKPRTKKTSSISKD